MQVQLAGVTGNSAGSVGRQPLGNEPEDIFGGGTHRVAQHTKHF